MKIPCELKGLILPLKKAIVVLLLAIALTATIAQGEVTGGVVRISEIRFEIIYDPLEDRGLAEVIMLVTGEEPSWLSVNISVFSETVDIELQGYNYTEGLLVGGLDYSREEGLIEAIVYGKGEIHVYLTVEKLLAEVGIGAYELYINTLLLKGITENVIVHITIPGHYEPYGTSIRGEGQLSFARTQGNTEIFTLGAGEYLVTLHVSFEELTPPSEGKFAWLVYILVPIIAAACLLAVYRYFNKKKKSVSVLLEHAGYLDSATRTILKALKNAGERGLTQAEIVKLTDLPKSSVSRKIRRLEEEGLVEVRRVGKYNVVYLTDKGLKLAEELLGG